METITLMPFDKFIALSFMGILTGLLSFAVGFLKNISQSISKLNTQVSILLERSEWHGVAINHLDVRVTKLEERYSK